jgi:hypothetical protein
MTTVTMFDMGDELRDADDTTSDRGVDGESLVRPGVQRASDWEIIFYEDQDHYPMGDGTGGPEDVVESRNDDIHYKYYERLSRLEAEVQSVRASTTRIEDKVGELSETVEQVDENSLDSERFAQQYEDEIQENSRITAIIKWAGGLVIVLMTAFLTLVEIGVGGIA